VVASDNPALIGFLKKLMNPDMGHPIRPDLDVALVMADWLEDQDDPRAGDVRAIAGARSALDPTSETVFWRWPGDEARGQSWWDLLVESLPEGKFYVRWHIDVRTEIGRTFVGCTFGPLPANGVTCRREDIPLEFERRLAELIVRLFGWSEFGWSG
jgi:uncharacterized protein (TIGR02996 family)